VLIRIYGPKKDEVTGKWRRICNEELRDLYSSPNIIWVIKTGIMRWTEHIARWESEEEHTGFLWDSQRERDHLGDLDMGGKIRLKWIIWKSVGNTWTDLGFCESGH
jgi:hypothetical protein